MVSDVKNTVFFILKYFIEYFGNISVFFYNISKLNAQLTSTSWHKFSGNKYMLFMKYSRNISIFFTYWYNICFTINIVIIFKIVINGNVCS